MSARPVSLLDVYKRQLVNNPRMITADEPTGNLDPVRSLELMLLLEKINELGTTVLVAHAWISKRQRTLSEKYSTLPNSLPDC